MHPSCETLTTKKTDEFTLHAEAATLIVFSWQASPVWLCQVHSDSNTTGSQEYTYSAISDGAVTIVILTTIVFNDNQRCTFLPVLPSCKAPDDEAPNNSATDTCNVGQLISTSKANLPRVLGCLWFILLNGYQGIFALACRSSTPSMLGGLPQSVTIRSLNMRINRKIYRSLTC